MDIEAYIIKIKEYKGLTPTNYYFKQFP